QPTKTFYRHEVSPVNRVAKENTSIRLRNDRLNARGVERNRGMFTRRSAAEVPPPDDDSVGRNELIVRMEWDVSLGQSRLRWRNARQRILAELAVLFRDRRVEGQVLGRDDLVRVDVVAQDIRLAGDDLLHDEANSPRAPHTDCVRG